MNRRDLFESPFALSVLALGTWRVYASAGPVAAKVELVIATVKSLENLTDISKLVAALTI